MAEQFSVIPQGKHRILIQGSFQRLGLLVNVVQEILCMISHTLLSKITTIGDFLVSLSGDCPIFVTGEDPQ